MSGIKSRICLNIGRFENSNYEISINQLFLGLILFDEVILRGGFTDAFALIEVLGPERANELIASGSLKFDWDIQTLGTFDGTNIRDTSVLRPAIISSADSNQILERRLHQLEMVKHRICIPKKVFLLLQRNILAKLKDKIPSLYAESTSNAKSVFAGNIDYIKESLVSAVEKQYQIKLRSSDLRLEVNRYQDIFEVKNNLSQLTDLTGDQIYKAIRSCYTRIEEPLTAIEFSQKYETFLAQNDFERANFQVGIEELLSIKNADPAIKNLNRVLEIGEVPRFEMYISDIKIDKLLAIRESAEIKYFRDWLNETKGLSEEELQKLLDSIWQNLLSGYHHAGGKVLRVVLSTMAAPLAGLGISIFDTFLAEKLLKPSVPISFIEQDLGSIFPLHATRD